MSSRRFIFIAVVSFFLIAGTNAFATVNTVLNASAASVSVNDSLSVTPRMTGPDQCVSYTFNVSFDQTKLQISTLSAGITTAFPPQAAIDTANASGLIVIGYADLTFPPTGFTPTGGADAFTVNFTVTGGAGTTTSVSCTGTIEDSTLANVAGTFTPTSAVTILCGASAAFTVNTSSATTVTVGTGQTVNFAATASAGLSWDFDYDGATHNGTSTLQNPTNTYATVGDYLVHLEVTAGCVAERTVTVQVRDCDVTAAFDDPADIFLGQAIAFNNTSTGTGTAWAWDFNSQGSSNLQNPSYTFTTAGTKTVQLTATGSIGGGCTTQAQQTVEVAACGVTAASFTRIPAGGVGPGDTITFTNTSTYAAPLGNMSWLWDFGDGTTSTAQNPTKTYAAEGTYPVTLTATSTFGAVSCSETFATDSVPVSICDAIPSFTPVTSNITVGQSVTFDGTVNPATISQAWNFGDGTSDTVVDPAAHTYNSTGTFNVTFTANGSTPAGCSTTANGVVNVACDATAAFTATPTTIQLGDSVTITQGSTNAASYAWNFGDGQTDTVASPPAHVFATAGNFTIALTVTSASGCTSTHQIPITVQAPTNEKPVLTLNGSLSMDLCLGGAAYTEPGYTATDLEDGNLTGSVVATGTVNINAAGTYTISYSVQDSAGNPVNKTRSIRVVDCTANNPPVVTLTGPGTVTVNVGATYTDAGATATDTEDGTITPTQLSNNVDTTKAGTYQVVWKAIDSGGLSATATRKVTVVAPTDTVPPVITVNGTNPMTVTKDASYTDAGATATDNVDGTFAATASGSVNTAVPGVYYITYTAKDVAGNPAVSVKRTVTVVDSQCANDTIPPEITITGANPIAIMVGTPYTDAGATAVDNVDGAVAATPTANTVDSSKVGSYPVTYNASDKCGNSATATRIVNVTDVEKPYPPVITKPTAADPVTITTTGYSHPKGTAHSTTHWEIATDALFANLVFTTQSNTALTSLPVPSQLLFDNTTYYVRASYMDASQVQSGWSVVESFMTGETNGDTDDDGVPDDQEVANPAAEFPNVDVTKALFVNSARGNAVIGVEISTNVTSIQSLEAVYPPELPGSLSKVDIQLGLIGFKIKVNTGANVEVKVHLSKDMPDNAKWYVYNAISGWFQAPAAQYTIVDKRTIILKLTDGGFGDVDNIANGWVVDPSGYGYTPGDTDSVTGSEDDCFIESSASASASGASAIALAIFAAVFALMGFITRNKK